ncbi:SpoIIE family protein phosphatase [Bernardetia sp.]|uniref:SpoIIE family protein phosphatase n=1 Tax=Bernardetia sp. TaxID=1937974 RepID=UPI0025BB212D|nr:SpoIIE family protein phosphatase [Bernardetia sp.]
MKYKHYLLLTLLLLFVSPTFAQEGTPPMEVFNPSDYNGAPDIRAVMQSKRGFLYVSSTDGSILEYDGVSWNKIPVPCQYVNTIKEDKNGNIFFVDMFLTCASYLRPNTKTGAWEVMPINFNLPDSIRQSGRVQIRLHQANEEIYFILTSSTPNIFDGISQVYKFENGELQPQKFELPSQKRIFITPQRIFQSQEEGKITVYDFEGIQTDSITITITSQQGPYQIEELGKDKFLILTVFDNLWVYDIKTKETKPLLSPNEAQIISTAQALNFHQLNNGNIAVGTVRKGLFILNKEGKIIKNISTAEGLNDDIVMVTTQDQQNQLWAGLYNGINKIDINAPISVWTKREGVLGSTTDNIIKFQNTYFAATISNLLYLDEKDNLWKPVEGTNIENHIAGILTLEDDKKHLFVGNINGVYEIVRNDTGGWKVKYILQAGTQFRIRGVANHISQPNKIYVWTLFGGIGYINYEENQTQIQPIESLKETQIIGGVTSIIQGDIWSVTRERRRPFKIDLPTEEVTILPYDSSYVGYYDGEFLLYNGSLDSTFKLDSEYKKTYYPELSQVISPYSDENLIMARDSLGSIWLFKAQEFFVRVFRKTEKGYQRDNFLEQSLGKYVVRGIYSDPDDKNIVWVSTSVGVLRADMSKSEITSASQENFNTYIRQIKIGKDSVIFDGNFVQTQKLDNDSTLNIVLANQPKEDLLSLTFDNNAIAFNVASPFFIEEKQIQFAYFLEGLDEKWSEWTSLNVKEYNNLKEGKYTFKVKAKNYLGQESTEATYQFEVLPPWHRTTLAFVLYFVFGAGIIFGSTRLYTHRLRKQNEHLENMVRERTDQIMQVNTELQQQNEEIVQQRDQLDTKNQQIEEQNKNIVSSINYAKRIQTALLPMEERVKQQIPKHFIFYQPRDIVSGDFYWIEKVEDKIIIAVADCTGHGVPGAFMSMLGSSGLSDAVFQQKLTSPELILTHLHNYIFSALKQSKSDNRDGMDIAIVVWNKAQNQLHYAGAMNPLYFIQNEELQTIKADKIPVGGTVSRERIYTPHTINLTTETTIYLASDGYQDQFGGKDSRKFMTKRFRELLLEISHLPMPEQEKRMADVFERWKGSHKQIDDVLVMGMKLS